MRARPRPDRSPRHYLVSLPASASLTQLVRLAHHRWAIEQHYQDLKTELGLDHFEGRTYPGWQHHMVISAVAYAFIQRERMRPRDGTAAHVSAGPRLRPGNLYGAAVYQSPSIHAVDEASRTAVSSTADLTKSGPEPRTSNLATSNLEPRTSNLEPRTRDVFSTSDTIVAIATPPGRGALGVVRLSGPEAARIVAELSGRPAPFAPRRATFARLALRTAGDVGDEVIVTSFPAPRSSTGEDCVEISAHGSPVVLASILRAAIQAGARLAEPGEFSLRAYLHGKRDLVQCEAVADLVEAVTPRQARVAFDQLQGTLTTVDRCDRVRSVRPGRQAGGVAGLPRRGLSLRGGRRSRRGNSIACCERLDTLLADAARGRLVREGAIVTLSGAPNVGKSSLFNALLNTNRAIVTPVPGTTRDLLTERVDIHGLVAGARRLGGPPSDRGRRRAGGRATGRRIAGGRGPGPGRARSLAADRRRRCARGRDDGARGRG